MSESLQQILKGNYDEFAKGNVDSLMSSLADDITWHVSGGSPLAGLAACEERPSCTRLI